MAESNTKNSPAEKKPRVIKPAVLIDDVRPPVRAPSAPSEPAPSRRPWLRREQVFAFGAGLVLAATTVYWALLGARLQAQNADQLVDSYLFHSWQTFQAAHFPATHTFLLKWPLFALGAALGNTPTVLEGLTVAVVLVTVLGFAGLLYGVVRRPAVWGLLALWLSLVLLLAPPQPYPGGLLPVNMAMLTTRNVEYLLYIGALVLLLRLERLRSVRVLWPIVLLTVLFASDRLFVPLSLGGALVLGVVAIFWRRASLRVTAVRWACVTVCAVILSVGLLSFIQLGGITPIENETTASPYTIARPHDVLLGVLYGAAHIGTYTGLNPASESTVLRDMPGAAMVRLKGHQAIAYVICWAAVLTLAWLVLRRRYRCGGRAAILLGMLGSSFVVAGASFVLTKHAYAVDARYLHLVFFAGALVAACVLRQWRGSAWAIRAGAAILFIGVISATYTAYATYTDMRVSLVPTAARNRRVADILRQHPVSTVVGDYWRVMPLRASMGGTQTVLPLENCTKPRTVLVSDAWRLQKGKSFAYLLSPQKGLTDYPVCQVAEVLRTYGKPNASVVVDGSVDAPKEMLLFYDSGARPSHKPLQSLAGVAQPGSLAEVAKASCPVGTIVSIVAHPDDDLLFMNPDIRKRVNEGTCVRTVYLTAGDAGHDSYYWLGRQRGSEAAYSTMLQHRTRPWQSQHVRVGDQYVTVSSPGVNARVSLLFFSLPDGGLGGKGFGVSGHESLQKLYEGTVPQLHGVEGHSSYTSQQLTDALADLLTVFQPDEVYTQGAVSSISYPDHSDHGAAGRFAARAVEQYTQESGGADVRMRQYVGYPVRDASPNVVGEQLHQKETLFMAYAQHDGGVCLTLSSCYQHSAYGAYLTRQYTVEEFQAAQ